MEDLGKWLIGLGIILVVVGAIIFVANRFFGLNLGRLPGDIVIQTQGISCFIPIVTSILLSIILTVLLALLSLFLRNFGRHWH